MTPPGSTTPETTLRAVVAKLPPAVVAVSGGVDSVTLAAFAHLHNGRERVAIVHAASSAVPREASERVRRLAARFGWDLTVIDAGEFADARYRANPSNRCFFCKTNLYDAIARCSDRLVLSGANLDDLADYRPGLEAARLAGARHPFVEAGLNKVAIRRLAHLLDLGEVAEPPSSPCLSSRVETGIPIDPAILAFVHRMERLVSDRLRPEAVRCRIRAGGVVVELDAASLASLDDVAAERLLRLVDAERPVTLRASSPSRFEPYRNGSAFLRSRR